MSSHHPAVLVPLAVFVVTATVVATAFVSTGEDRTVRGTHRRRS